MADTVVDILPTRKPMIGTLRFDASLSEEHGTEVELTDTPIEAGSTITDHALVLPKAITMVVGITSTPDELLSVPFDPTRHLRMWRQIDALIESRALVDVVTSLRIYPSMMLTSIRTTRTRDTSNSLQIAIRARRLEFALVGGAQQIADRAQDLALGAVDLGAQQALVAAAAEIAALGVLASASRVSNAVPNLIPS